MAEIEEAVTLYRQGRFAEAGGLYEGLVREYPRNANIWYQFSVVRAAEGRLEGALEAARQAVVLMPQAPWAHSQVGALLLALNRPADAVRPLAQASTLDPTRADVQNNLGAAMRAIGRHELARARFERALGLDPTYEDAAFNLAGTLVTLKRETEAIPYLEPLIAAGSSSAAVYAVYGRALWQDGRLAEALAALERARELDPDFPEVYAHLGHILEESGDLAGAVAAFERAISLAPDRGDYYLALATTDVAAITAEHRAALERLAVGNSGTDSSVEFALGRVLAASDPARSFEHFLTANAAARASLEYRESENVGAFERIASVFTASFLRAHRSAGVSSQLPIFVFGMPRSGTTLVEQILASHPAVHGAGELELFQHAIDAVVGGGEPPTPEQMLAVTDAQISEVGSRYVESLAALAPDAQRITDKLPANFRFAGIIHLALPNARMIHVRRDPLDTCISCFSTYFAAEGLAWTYDLRELGRYYRGYAKLMEHWRSILPPDAMLEVQYEDVVADTEGQARRILGFCGLPWDDRCLAFYKHPRPIKTASVSQVRRPIYSSSVGKARIYGDALRPLIDELNT